MSAAATAAAGLRARVERVCAERGVPGVTAAVLADRDVAPFALGVLDVRTRTPLTVDAQVPIASVSKVFTATVVVALAEAGLVDLDAPLAAQVPMPADAAAGPAGRATPRQLLTHSSGIEGDFFLDPGAGDDAVERYVARSGSLRTIHPPDLAASYCNTGMVLLSRLAEVALGCPWPRVVAQALTGPIGVPSVQALDRGGTGGGMVGHVGPSGAREPAPPRPFPRAVAAAGGMWATPSETLELVRPHLAGGEPVARRLGLSPEAVARMQCEHVVVPGPAWLLCPQAWGLGWSTYAWDGGRVIGHDGGGAGTSSFLRVVPEAGVAVVLVANVGDCGPELGAVVAATVTELTGARPPQPLQPGAPLAGDVDVAALAGWYAGSSEGWLVGERDGGLEVRTGAWDAVPAVSADAELLLPWDPSGRRWVAPAQDAFRLASPVTFTDLPDGRLALHRFGRVAVS